MSSTYREVLGAPGVATAMSAQLVARFPAGMYTIGLLLHMEAAHGNYASAGLVLAMLSIGQAVATPVITRLMSRFGTRNVILFTNLVSAAAVLMLALWPVPLWADVALGLLTGLTLPPITPAVRTLYPRLVSEKQLAPLYALDATLQELIFVFGPVAITFLSAGFTPAIGLSVGAAIQVLGGLWFALLPAIGNLRIPPSTKRMGAVLRKRPVLLVMVVGTLIISGFAAGEAGVVAQFGHDSFNAGIVMAVSSVGSLLGGFALGQRSITTWSLAIRVAIMAFGFALAPFMMHFFGLNVAMFVSGLGCAPALGAMSAIVAGSVKFADTPEAYGWVAAGQMVGAALASAIAGIAIDGVGPAGAMWVAVILCALGGVVAAVFRRAQPDLTQGVVQPPPTAPIELPR